MASRFRLTHLCAATAVIAVACALSNSATVHAQDSASATSEAGRTDTGEIIVTARRVAERVQDVPISISVASGAQLQQKGAITLSDTTLIAPGLGIQPTGSIPATVSLTMRGQTQTEVLATVEPSIGTYVDEMYWARAYGLNASLLDVSNVQVLKGPQGTLFGRNTTGGAMLLSTNDPRLGDLSGSAEATYGRFNEATGNLILNIPLASNVAFRGAMHASRRDGWQIGVRQYNLATGLPDNGFLPTGQYEIRPDGSRYSSRDELLGRAKLLWELSDSTSLLLSGEWFDYKTETTGRQLLYKVNLNDTSSAGDNVAASTAVLAYQNYFASNPRATGADGFSCDFAISSTNCQDTLRPFDSAKSELSTQTYTAKLTSQTGVGQIKFIGGYRRVKNTMNGDLDGSATLIHDVVQLQDLHQWSAELQLTGSTLEDRLDYAAGVTYFNEGGTDRSFSFSTRPGGTRRNNATRNYGEIFNDSIGAYGQASFKILEALTFTGGLRYSRDKKGIEVRSANVGLNGQLLALGAIPAGSPAGLLQLNNPCNAAGSTATPLATAPTMRFDIISGATPANDCAVRRADTFDAFSWTAGLDYKINPDVLIYAKISRGYRAGGQNFRAFNDYQFQAFRPEMLTEQEIGLKSDLFDRLIRLNLSVYRNVLEDAQRNIQQNFGLVNNTLILNAAKVRNLGVEGELTIRPYPGLSLNASGSYNDFTYANYRDSVGDRSGDRAIYIPDYTLAVGANYATQVTDTIGAAFDVSYSYRGKMAGDRCTVTGISACWTGSADATGRTTQQISQDIFNATTIPGSGVMNARVTVTFDEEKYSVSLWGRNILNDQSVINLIYLAAPYRNYVSTDRREPATYGVTAAVKF